MIQYRYFFCLSFLSFIFSCAQKEDVWINGDKKSPSNIAKFKGNKLTLTLETIDVNAGLVMEEFVYEIDERIVNKYDKNNSLYILRAKTGRYSALPEYKFNNDSIKLETSIANAQLDTKEELMYELNRKMRVYDMGIDSLEEKYSLFGSAKVIGKVFKRDKH